MPRGRQLPHIVQTYGQAAVLGRGAMVLARRSGLEGCRWLALRGIDDGTSFRLSSRAKQSLQIRHSR